MEKKNILIGKIGKAVKFRHLHIETGDDAVMILYSSLARMNPEFNFYFGGPNEISKLTEQEYDYIFPNHNVFSANFKDATQKEWYKPTLDYFEKNNIKIDFALLMSGMCSRTNIPNFLINRKTGNPLKSLMAFSNYSAPYIYLLNKLGCPLYLISEDARYITLSAKDLYNRERLVFSQINQTFKLATHIKDESDLWQEDMVSGEAKAVYSGCERIFMMALDPNWKDKIDIDRKLKSTNDHLIVISNGCGQSKPNTPGTNSARYDTYKKWIIDGLVGTPYEGSKIYGVWDEETYEKCPSIQNKMMVDLGDDIADAKYSFVYSIMPGFVTVKPWEMIIRGLIPFMHPDYDKYHLLGLPEYLYVKDVDDFVAKMKELDENPDKYVALLNECFSHIKEEDLNGKRLNNFIFDTIADDLGFEYTEKEGCESIFNHFAREIFDNTKCEK